MFAGLNPNFSRTTGPGAEAPKRSRPTTSPLEPTYFHQPRVAPASTASLGTPAGKTLALYSGVCSSNIFQLGKLTMRARVPSAASSFAASRIAETSEPVPSKTTCGFSASCRTYAPLLTPAYTSTAAGSMTGRSWRLSAKKAGPLRSRASLQAAAVSLASAGRKSVRSGTARNIMRCSTG